MTVDELIPSHLQGLADHLYVVFTDWVPSCGCGYPDQAVRLIHDLLRVAESGDPDREKRYEALCGTTGALQIVLAALDKAELMSHATTITLSSATDRGRWVLWAIDQLGGIDRLPAVLEAAGYPHYEPHMATEDVPECTDACWTIPAEESEYESAPVSAEGVRAGQPAAVEAGLEAAGAQPNPLSTRLETDLSRQPMAAEVARVAARRWRVNHSDV